MAKRTYPPRLAKTVYGGLRPQGGRRDAWWSKRWIEWLESLHMGARLGRGRNYAQLGQIKTLTILPGELSADVQGASDHPYHITARMPVLAADRVQAILDAHPFLTAQLFAHTFPIGLHERLMQAGLQFFPQGRSEIFFYCNCKDHARPCKHLAAAFCLFADAIAADPMLLFRFRGILLPEEVPELRPQVLSSEAFARLRPTQNAGSIPRRLGKLPYWRGSEDFLKSLEMAYQRAHERALLSLDTLHADFRFPEDIPPEIVSL